MGGAPFAIICSLAAMSLSTAAPYDPTRDFIDRSIFRDQRLFNSDLIDAHSSGFLPSQSGAFFGSNILATPQVLRSSVAAQVPLLTLAPCPKGLVRNAAGRCVKPVVLKNVFLFKAPFVKAPKVPPPKIPKPKVLYNYVYVNSADSVKGPKPIVVPPPQEKTLVYVLNKRPDPIKQEVIEVPPAADTEPEVFFINYNEGENQQLPGGVDLHTVLSQSAVAGQQGLPLGGGDLSLFAESSAAAAAFGDQLAQIGGQGLQLGGHVTHIGGQGLQLGGHGLQFGGQGLQLGGQLTQLGGQGLELGGQVTQIGGLSNGDDFDFSDEKFEDRISSISGLSSFNFPSSARSFTLPVDTSAVQRLIPTISSDSSFLDQNGDFSTVGGVTIRNGFVSQSSNGGNGDDNGGGDGDSKAGESAKDEGGSEAKEESSEGDSEGSPEKRSTKVIRKYVAQSSAKPTVASKSVALSKSPSKKGKSVVIAVVKPPTLKPKFTVADDLKSSASETVAVETSVLGDDTMTIPVLTSEDVKELLEKSEPKESS